MSKVHLAKCDFCNRATVNLKWNGEHWLVPSSWGQLYDDENHRELDLHVCPNCKPKPKTDEAKLKKAKK